VTVFDGVLRLLHPVMPFVTEELWHKLPGHFSETIMKVRLAPGTPPIIPVDEKIPGGVRAFSTLQEIVTAIRTSRSELNVPPSAQVKVSTKGDGVKFDPASQPIALLKTLCRVNDVSEAKQRPAKSALAVVKGGEVYLHLEGLIDLKAEAAKQQKEREKLAKYVQAIEGKLKNEQFVKNAPAELVDGEKAKLQETKDKIDRIDSNLKFLES
jgi:valyl-tRNA synthetase